MLSVIVMVLVCVSLEGLGSFVINFANNINFSGIPFHNLTATCVKLQPVDWILDFGSSRA